MNTKYINLYNAKEKMKDCNDWVIICHENPDGDTLCSGLSLYSLGTRLGKNVRVLGKDPFPSRYQFLPYASIYERYSETVSYDKSSLFINVDVGNEERGIPALTTQAINSLNIDHHGDNNEYMGINIVDPTASATVEIVCDIICSFEELTMTKDEAELLYVGLVTDNGNFRFSSTTSKSHRCASILLDAGLDPSYIDDVLNENLTQESLILWGKAFLRTETYLNGIVASFWLTKDELDHANAEISTLDGIVNMLMRIKGIKIAVFIYFDEFNAKISIRTKDMYSAREIATSLGGGGHVRAAGAKMLGNMDEIKSKVRMEIIKYANFRNPTNK
ncbi:MAG: bifunctional oligoribonuclease/PAP phosphatase NrnA [Synergistaceae bacterium]